MDWFRRMMAGRYGMDYLNHVLMWTGFILSLVQWVTRWRVLGYVVWALVFCWIFRMLSRNYGARSRENQWFMGWFEPLKWKVSQKSGGLRQSMLQWKNRQEYKRQQKAAYAFFACPHCGQKIRIPKGRGKVRVACPTCQGEFDKRT